jgi:hypothetical protein
MILVKFEIADEENGFAFPCSVCSNQWHSSAECRTCKWYSASNMDIYDFKKEVNKISHDFVMHGEAND